jgi:uncharacterized membrane protein
MLFLHLLGWSVWLGASLTFMVWGSAAASAPLEAWAHTWNTLARVQRLVVAPACMLATLSGIVLSMNYARAGFPMDTTWLIVMQALGMLAAILTLALATPLANRVALLAAKSVEAGARDPRAEAVRKKLAVIGSITGTFLLVALYFAAAKPA